VVEVILVFPSTQTVWRTIQPTHMFSLCSNSSAVFGKDGFFFHFWLVVHHSFKAFKKYIVYELKKIFFFFSVFSHHKILLATIIYQNLILVMVSIIPHIKQKNFLRRLYSDNKILWPKVFIKSITTSPNNN
jgi:hypothetical protein